MCARGSQSHGLDEPDDDITAATLDRFTDEVGEHMDVQRVVALIVAGVAHPPEFAGAAESGLDDMHGFVDVVLNQELQAEASGASGELAFAQLRLQAVVRAA